MPSSTVVSEESILEAIRSLLPDLPALLSDTESQHLSETLNDLLSRADKPGKRERAISVALDAIKRYPSVHQRFQERVRITDSPVKGYQPLAQPVIKDVGGPGVRVVCPKNPDPEHCERYRRMKGERLRCPVHQVELIPADQEKDNRTSL